MFRSLFGLDRCARNGRSGSGDVSRSYSGLDEASVVFCIEVGGAKPRNRFPEQWSIMGGWLS